MTTDQNNTRHPPGQGARAMSALMDGALDDADLAQVLADDALPWTEECTAAWRGYCVAGSVLRGELGGGAPLAGGLQGQGPDLAARIRAQLAVEPPLEMPIPIPAAGRTAQRRWGHRGEGSGERSMGRRVASGWRRAIARARSSGSRRHVGAAVAFGAAAISVAIGVSNNRGALDSDASSPAVAGLAAPTMVLNLADSTGSADSASVTVAGARMASAAPTDASRPAVRAAVPRVEATAATVAHQQLPYFFAHASATSAAYQPGGMTLMPIAATDLASHDSAAVRH